ncbi:zinc finger protein 813-like [Anopheles ziemanni]|nr:zinc finger protein 813-like [Anopheles ziemanni]
MYGCAASFCTNTRYLVKQRKENITFHTFPVDKAVCREWIQFCKQHEQWTPTKQSVICSSHFQPEDYQLPKQPLHEKRIGLRRLHSDAVPSIMNKEELTTDEGNVHYAQTDSKPFKYRDQFCRTCLKHCQNCSIPVDSEIQNMTVLDMLIQLTAFETDDNEAFPTVICLLCSTKLQQAFNIRQEFIAQSELLVQMAAEQNLIDYFDKVSAESYGSTDDEQSKNYSILEDINDETRSDPNDCLSVEHEETYDCGDEDDEDQSQITDSFDHSCYTKIENQLGAGSVDMGEGSGSENKTIGDESATQEGNGEEIQPKRKRRQFPPLHTTPDDGDSWESFQRFCEQEKAAKRKRLSEIQSLRRAKQNKGLSTEQRKLDEEARKRFPFTTCYICDRKHNTLMDRDYHMREHIHMLPYECNECSVKIEGTENSEPIVLNTTHKLNLHFRMHRMPHKCVKCYHRFSTKTKLKTHFWASHGYAESGGLTCEYCGKQYFHKIAFRKHVAHHRNELSGQFKCSICDRTFGVKSSLQRHEASHKGEKKYKCLYCEKSFSTSYNRLNHHRIHTGEGFHKCSECDRLFSQKSALRYHQQTHLKVRPKEKTDSITKAPKTKTARTELLPDNGGTCPYPGCVYTATSYSAMYMHKRSKHEPMVQCEVCNKQFAFANQLKIHMTLHTGEKPYQCELCNRSFRLIKDYRWHLATHDSDTSYACKICQKSFKLQRYLQAHILTHSTERKFSCDICGNSYKTKGELKKHTQHKHSEEIIREIIIKSEVAFGEEHVASSILEENKFTLDV